MTTTPLRLLSLHLHHTQAQRGHPLTGALGPEAAAAPHRHWLAAADALAFQALARAGIYQNISFTVTPWVLAWLRAHSPGVYAALCAADAATQGALATPYHDTLLPLLPARDRWTELQWGLTVFREHFGRAPLGVWLPQMATDTETLLLLRKAGLRYTVLAEHQVRDLPRGGGPFRVVLPESDSPLAVFVRQSGLSDDLSFRMGTLGGPHAWAHNALAGYTPMTDSGDGLLVLSTDADNFGLHHPGQQDFLPQLFEDALTATGYTPVTLDVAYQRGPARGPVVVQPDSSWNDWQTLDEWRHGRHDTAWRGPLRGALALAASDLDVALERVAGAAAWPLRDGWGAVLVGAQTPLAYVRAHATSVPTSAHQALATLLSAHVLSLRARASHALTTQQLDTPPVRYAVASMAAALAMASHALGTPVGAGFAGALAHARAHGVSGADVLSQAEADLGLALPPQLP